MAATHAVLKYNLPMAASLAGALPNTGKIDLNFQHWMGFNEHMPREIINPIADGKLY